MAPARFVRGVLASLGLLALAAVPLAAVEASFSSGMSAAQLTASGLDQLNAGEQAALDQLVASDLATARQLRITTFGVRFSTRHASQSAVLDRLDEAQRAQLDELVADAIAAQPLPKERPRLRDNEVVSLRRRLEVHGGLSFTVGWASGGRNYREAGAWVSYFDPESGLGLAVAYSQGSGDLPSGYGYGYPSYGYGPAGWYGAIPQSAYDVDLFWVRPNFSLDLGFSQAEFPRWRGFESGRASPALPGRRPF